MRSISIGVILAVLGALFVALPAAAWHVKTDCEVIKYDGYTYRVYDADYKLIQDWTKGDTQVPAGEYKVKFTNGEKTKVSVPGCELAVNVEVSICGDPRLFGEVSNVGNQDTYVRFVYRKGKFKSGGKTFDGKRVDAGDVVYFGQYWARKAKVRVKAWDRTTRTWETVLIIKREQFQATPWGEGGCPANRFGIPDFSRSHYSGRLVVTGPSTPVFNPA